MSVSGFSSESDPRLMSTKKWSAILGHFWNNLRLKVTKKWSEITFYSKSDVRFEPFECDPLLNKTSKRGNLIPKSLCKITLLIFFCCQYLLKNNLKLIILIVFWYPASDQLLILIYWYSLKRQISELFEPCWYFVSVSLRV